MLIPIRTDSPLRRTPYVNWALILANVIVFIFMTALADHGRAIKDKFALNPQDPQIWGYFTYQFLHANFLHIASNMLFLYIFGNNVNDRLGNLGYLGFYLAGGVFAGMGHMLTAHAPVIGASGAIAAVTGAYLILLPRSHITILYFFYLIGTLEIPGLWFVLGFFMLDVLAQFSPQLMGGASEVAHMAHISGTVFGATICLILLSVHLLPRDQFDVVALIQRWNRRRQYRDLVNKGYNPFDYIPPERSAVRASPTDAATQQIIDLRAQISEAIAHHQMPRAAELYLQLKTLDPNQVLARQSQLDIANQLASQQMYQPAADAYELFLRNYANYERIENVQLMLGMIYGRYLNQFDRARELLVKALTRLHNDRDIQWVREELARIEPLIVARGPAA